jgi:predicted chitinase
MANNFEPVDLFRYLRSQFGPLSQAQVDAINRILEGEVANPPFVPDRKVFFDTVRTKFGRLDQSQVDGFGAILDEWDRRKLYDRRWLAYILATAWHETASHMQPVIESRSPKEDTNPSVDEAIRRLERAYAAGKLSWVKTPYWRKNAHGLSYLGRGLPQLTHESNYRKLGDRLGVDLVGFPDRALEPRYAIPVMFVGMIEGLYTGKKLADYFNDSKDDPYQARRIVNGVESASTVKGHHTKFLAGLQEKASA